VYDGSGRAGGRRVIPLRRGSHDSLGSTAGVWGDLAVATTLTIAAAAVLLSAFPPWPLRWVVGIPFLLVWPGYAVVSALYPERPRKSGTAASAVQTADSSRTGAVVNPGWAERTALSIALSGSVVALVVIAVNRAAAIRTSPVVGGVSLVTLAGLGLAANRRLAAAPEDRAAPVAAMAERFGSEPAGETRGAGFGRGADGGEATTSPKTVALMIAAALLIVSVAVVGAVPPQGEGFSESSLLAENASGDLVATDYPTTFVAGEGHPLFVAIENNEHRPVSYEVVVLAQDIAANGSVAAQLRVDDFEVDTVHGEREVVERRIAPRTTGEGVRLRFLIYRSGDDEGTGIDTEGNATDAEIDPDDADLTLQLWIDVVDEDNE